MWDWISKWTGTIIISNNMHHPQACLSAGLWAVPLLPGRWDTWRRPWTGARGPTPSGVRRQGAWSLSQPWKVWRHQQWPHYHRHSFDHSPQPPADWSILATLLGSPLGDIEGIWAIIPDKMESLRTMGGRPKFLHTQDALLLLCHSIAFPRLSYTLQTAPCFLSPEL